MRSDEGLPESNKQREFEQKELQEGANMYRFGTQFTQNILNSLLVGNGILGAFFGASAGLLKDGTTLNSRGVLIIPAVGVAGAILVFFYSFDLEQLIRAIQERCIVLETKSGGQLFSLAKSLEKKEKLGSFRALRMFCLLLVCLWSALAVWWICSEIAIHNTKSFISD
jgi:hypothetical protein